MGLEIQISKGFSKKVLWLFKGSIYPRLIFDGLGYNDNEIEIKCT